MATNRVKLEDVINQAKEGLEAGNTDYVIALCRYIFKYYPRALEVTRLLGEAYTEKKVLDEADQLFVYVLAADPHDVLGYVDRGFVAYERGSIDEAILYYERAIELDPNIEQLRLELLRLYKERYGGTQMRVRMTKAGLANHRMRDGFYNQAIEEYNTILNETPDRLDIQTWLMEAYWHNRDYARAEKLALELVESHPYLIKANLILWHIYGVRRNEDRAAEYLDKAHALDPLNMVAERLFEDREASNDALTYISMLGIAMLPAFDPTQLEVAPTAEEAEVRLLPAWVTADPETDRRLGLKGEATEEESFEEVDSNIENDWLAQLLSETENRVQTTKETEEKVAAQADLEQLRQSAADDEVLGSLFEEIEENPAQVEAGTARPTSFETAPDFDFNLQEDKSNAMTVRAFDREEAATEDSLDSLFEELQTGQVTVPFEPLKLDEEPAPFDPDFIPAQESREIKTQDELNEYARTEKNQIRPDKIAVGTSPVEEAEAVDVPPPSDLDSILMGSTEPEFELFAAEEKPQAVAAEETFEPDFNLVADEEVDRPTFTQEPIQAAFGAEEPARPTFEQAEAGFLPFEVEENEAEAAELSFATPIDAEVEKIRARDDRGPGLTGALDDFFAGDSYEVDLFAPTLLPEELEGATAAPASVSEAAAQPELDAAVAAPEDLAEAEPEAETADENAEAFTLEVAQDEEITRPSSLVETEASPVEAVGVEPEEEEPIQAEVENLPQVAQPDDNVPNYLFDSAAVASEEAEELEPPTLVAVPVGEAAIQPEDATREVETKNEVGMEAHAFHRRDERGPIPEAMAHLAEAQSVVAEPTGQVSPNFEEAATSIENSLQPAIDYATAVPGTPGMGKDKENEEMPIKRGGQDDEANVFDWEREELPDYLRDFALDEDEVAQRQTLNPPPMNPPIGSDMTTGPARIRPREPEPVAPNDLPQWLTPSANRQPPQINLPSGDQIDLGNGMKPGGSNGGPLPGWLDANDTSSKPNLGMSATPKPESGGLDDLGDLKPFSLDENDGFGGPSLQPPAIPSAPANRQPPPPMPPSRPEPPSFQPPMGLDLGDDIQPFSFEGMDGGSVPPPPPVTRQAPPPPPPMQRPTPPPAQPSFEPPVSPFGLGDDLNDIAPFNPLDFGEAPTNIPAPPPPPAQSGRPAMPQQPPAFQPPAPPPSFGGSPATPAFGGFDDDLGDLRPFSLDDSPTPPPPPAQNSRPTMPQQPPAFQPPTPPPAAFQPPVSGPAPFNPLDLDAEIPPFNPFDLTGEAPKATPPTPPPANPAPFSIPGMPDVAGLPPMGGEGFVQAGPGSLKPFDFNDMGGSAPPPTPPKPPAGKNLFPSDLPEVDLEPFSAGMDIPGLNEPTSFKANLDNLSDEPFYPQPRPRNRPPEPEFEVEPGQEKPLQSFGWLKDRQRKRRDDDEETDNKAGKSLFEKLAERRRAQAPQSVDLPPPDLEGFEAEEVDRFADYIPFEEIEQQATETEGATQVPVTPTTPLTPTAEPAVEPFSFDFGGDEPAGKDLAQPFKLNIGPEPEPTQPFSFDFGAEPEKPAFSQPTSQPEEPPFSFDFGGEKPQAEPAQPFNFDFSAAEPEKPASQNEPTEPFSFDFGSIEPEPKAAPSVEPFSFDFGAPSEPEKPEPAPEPPTQPFSFDFGGAEPEKSAETFSFDFDANEPSSSQPDQKFDFDFGALDQSALSPNGQPAQPFNLNLEEEKPAVAKPAEKPFSFDLEEEKPAIPQPFNFEFEPKPAEQAPTAFNFEPEKGSLPLPDFNFGETATPVESSSSASKAPEKEPVVPDFAFEQPAKPVVPPTAQEVPPPPPVTTPPVQVQPQAVATNGDLSGYLNRVKQSPKDLEANLQVAEAYYAQSQYTEAIPYFNTAVKVADPNALKDIVSRLEKITASSPNPRFHRVLGDAYMKQGQYHWALSEYSKALGPAGAKK